MPTCSEWGQTDKKLQRFLNIISVFLVKLGVHLPAAFVPSASAQCLYPPCPGRAGPAACAWQGLCSSAESGSAGTQLLHLLISKRINDKA